MTIRFIALALNNKRKKNSENLDRADKAVSPTYFNT
jgi:hypothetical protein